MTITFTANDTEIDPSLIQEFHVISDIYTLIPRATFRLTRSTTLQTVPIGADLRVDLKDDDGDILLSSVFYITDVDAKPDEGGTPGEYSNITVTGRHTAEIGPNWSRGVFGPVSTIMRTALSGGNPFSETTIEDTSDLARIRYQMNCPTPTFLNQIAKYGVSQGSAMYLYADIFGRLFYRSRKSLESSTPKYEIYYLSESDVFNRTPTYPQLVASTGSLSQSTLDSSHQRASKFQTQTFNESDRIDTPGILNLNSKVGFNMNTNTSFYDWTLSPYEGAALSTNLHRRMEDKLSEVVVILNTIYGVQLGDLVYHNSYLARGIYLVSYLDYLSSDRTLLTKLVLTKVRDE